MSAYLRAASSCDPQLPSHSNYNVDAFVTTALDDSLVGSSARCIGEPGKLTLLEALTIKRACGRSSEPTKPSYSHLVDTNKPFAAKSVTKPLSASFGLPENRPPPIDASKKAQRAKLDALHLSYRNQILTDCQGSVGVRKAALVLQEPSRLD